MLFRKLIPAIFLVTVILLPLDCLSGGLLHVFPPVLQGEAFAVARPTTLRSMTLITVSESSITYRIDQTFYNNNEFPLEALYLLPVKDASRIGNVELKVNGVSESFQIVSSEKFFPTLRDLARDMKDSSLLELAGRDLLVKRPVNLGVKEQRTFTIEYSIPISAPKDHLEITLSLVGERFSLGPVGELEVRVRYKMARAIRNIFSPSHNFSVFRESPYRCQILVREEDKPVRHDFRLLTTFAGRDLDLSLFTHRKPGEKGTFMAFVAPPMLQSRDREPKDVVFLLDASGSLSRSNFEQARRAVVFCLSRLGSEDRFNVLLMGTQISKMADELVSASKENVLKAVRFVDSASDRGGTDLYNGLVESLKQFYSRRRLSAIMLVGDGRATVGITDPKTIVDDLRNRNRVGSRIFVLALGEQPDLALLDKVAASTRGKVFSRLNIEDFETTMARFMARISPPQVTELSLTLKGITTENVFPQRLPDLAGNESAIILGKYEHDGDVRAEAVLRAKVQGRGEVTRRTFLFPQKDERHPYVPALLAMRQLSRLLEREWLRGPEIAVRGRIDKLSQEFGFRIPGRTHGNISEAPVHTTPGEKIETLLWRLKRSNLVYGLESQSYRMRDGKVFRLSEGRWIDTKYRRSIPSTTVRFLDDEYFDLLKEDPEIGRYLSIGPEVTLVRDNKALVVTAGPQAAP